MRSRKGTEKPIEIFVALFIILAVALVMLKLFQGQIADKQKELSDVQQEQKSKELLSKVRQACSDKCVEASNSQCSLQSLASLCMYNSQTVLGPNQYIDLNNDQTPDMDTTLLAGFGVCENKIYCFHVLNSCCAREINAAQCRSIITTYWAMKRVPDPQAQLYSTVDAGGCTNKDGSTTGRWDLQPDWKVTP